jgi:flavodoxin
MRKLIVYYSLEGNTRLIAGEIAEEIGADILELKPKKDIQSKGFMRYFWGGKQVMQKEKPELLPLDIKIQDYDLLMLGTPVWAGNYAPVYNTLFESENIKNKKIALFCCHGGGKGKVFNSFKTALEGNEIIGELDLKDPLKNDRNASAANARQWARSIVAKIEA